MRDCMALRSLAFPMMSPVSVSPGGRKGRAVSRAAFVILSGFAVYWQTAALVLLPFMVQWAQRYLSRVSFEMSDALFIGAGWKDGLLLE